MSNSDIEAITSVEISAGHRLFGYQGPCKNLHGHNYKIIIHIKKVAFAPFTNYGMVWDFSDMKRTLTDFIKNIWDHAVILDQADTDIIEFLKSQNMKYYIMKNNPTAENMAQHLLEELSKHLTATVSPDIVVTKLELYETSNNYVSAFAY